MEFEVNVILCSMCIFVSKQIIYSRNKGVKVVLDVPDTMWDAPSAEITQLKKYVRQIILI